METGMLPEGSKVLIHDIAEEGIKMAKEEKEK